jgi:hypothetical protein
MSSPSLRVTHDEESRPAFARQRRDSYADQEARGVGDLDVIES